MPATVERTGEAIIIKLPLNTKVKDIQCVLNYFEYIDLVSESKATQEQIDALAKEAKSGWWEKNKQRFAHLDEFKDLI